MNKKTIKDAAIFILFYALWIVFIITRFRS